MKTETQDLIKKFEVFLNEGKRHDEPYRFNVLDLQQGNIVENSHTNILMQLLQHCDCGSHLFLQCLLERWGVNALDQCQDTHSSLQFDCERTCGGKRIDGLIWIPDAFAIIIENKVNGASDGKNQLGSYINSIKEDKAIFPTDDGKSTDKIWVVYLTRDGGDPNDSDSVNVMTQLGICDPPTEGNPLEGARYVAASYREHILPWLEDDVYPMIRNNDVELSSGVMQYICYLKGANFFDLNQQPTEEDLKWLVNAVALPASTVERNKTLHLMYQNVVKEDVSPMVKNRLLGVIQAEAQKPMTTFLEVTRNHFGDCDVSHHFTFYYINMRPTKQARAQAKVTFSWPLLGIKRLSTTTPQDLVFSTHVSGSQPARNEFVKRFGLRLCTMGYEIEEKITRLLVYRCHVQINTGLLNMDDAQQRAFLQNVYNNLAPAHFIRELVDGQASVATSGYEGIGVDRVNAYQKAMAAIYNQGKEKYSLRLATSPDGIVLDAHSGEVTLAPSKNNVGRPVLELHGLTTKQREALTDRNIAKEWFLQTHDHRNNSEVRVTAFGIEVQQNIHLPAEELLHNTVQNAFKVFDSLIERGNAHSSKD